MGIVCAVLAVCLIGLLIAFWIRERRVKKRISDLTEYITKVLDNAELPKLEEVSESRFGILQSEIYKVVTLLREEYSTELKQKKYMSDMMADISHQFKTPLTAIQIMTDLLMQPDLAEERRLEYAMNIDNQTERMTWLIRSLLTLAQLEAGTLEMRSERIVLKDMIDQINESAGIMAEAAEVELEFDIPSEIAVTGDPGWLREAVSNIVKNAIEHTPAGGKVCVNAVQTNLCTQINIVDTGKGIDPKDLPHIFERFYKAGNASVNSVGIGLAMAKQIIGNLGGSITVSSEPGKGSDFEIKLYS
jgi:signal transduction histidine kinase